MSHKMIACTLLVVMGLITITYGFSGRKNIDDSNSTPTNSKFLAVDSNEGPEAGVQSNREYSSNPEESIFFDADVNNVSVDHSDPVETDSLIDEHERFLEDLDLGQVDEIAKHYYGLIKQKDRGGLIYPSDSVYRITILADLVFTAALKESKQKGKKFLKQKFTLDRLV
ncbi:hypothetical protein Bhyg_02425, partial [Pseudolycoriella hygida]